MADHPSVGTPSRPDHGTPKSYVEALLAASAAPSVRLVEIPIDGSLGPGTYDTMLILPVTTLIVECLINIPSAFDGATTLRVGQFGFLFTDFIMEIADSDPSIAGDYHKKMRTPASSTNPIKVTVGGAPTTGFAYVQVYYVLAAGSLQLERGHHVPPRS